MFYGRKFKRKNLTNNYQYKLLTFVNKKMSRTGTRLDTKKVVCIHLHYSVVKIKTTSNYILDESPVFLILYLHDGLLHKYNQI